MKIVEDLAWILAEISCYQNMIPTGSPLSQILAFWSYKHVFDGVADICDSQGYLYSVYVDDVTISSSRYIPADLHLRVRKVFIRSGLRIKSKKTRYLHKSDHKQITGVVISPDHLLKVPNKNVKRIVDDLTAINRDNRDLRRIRSCLGRIRYARRISPELFANVYRNLRTMEARLMAEARMLSR